MSDAAVGAGSVLSGRYRLVELLAHGGMGSVWRAVDLLLDRPVAVKEVRLPPGLDDEARTTLRRRTIREAQAAARLKHSAIVTIYDVVEQDGRPWIVMELVAAPSLADLVRTRGPLPPVRVAGIALRVLDAMVTAQAAGVQHRDIKPANILVTDEGRVVLTDFGIARHVGDETLTAAGLLIGSPDYLAPERARGRSTSGLSADLWSLGATMYDAVEGRRPFARNGPLPTLAAVVMDEPAPPVHAGPLQPVIDGLLAKDPAHRLDADRTRALLQRVVRGRPAELDPAGAEPDGAGAGPAEAGPAGAAESDPAGAAVPATLTVPREPVDDRPAAPPASPSSPPSPRRPSRRKPALAGLLLVLLLAAGALLLPRAFSGDPPPPAGAPASSPRTATTAPTAARTSAVPTSAAPTSAAPTSAGPTSQAPATGASLSAPAGFTRYRDPRDGFSVVVPAGWRPVRRDTRVDFDDPASSRFLRIDTSDTPLADPYQNWVDYERTFRQGKADYRLIGIRRVPDYRPGAGWTTADWEFTLGGTHVLDRNIRVNSARAHAIYFSAPSGQWGTAESTRVFDLAAASFVPAPVG